MPACEVLKILISDGNLSACSMLVWIFAQKEAGLVER